MPVHKDGGDTLRRIEVITGTVVGGGTRRRRAASWLRALSQAAACLRWPGVMTSAPVFCFFGGGRRRRPCVRMRRGGPAFVPMVVSGDTPAAPVVNEACVVEVELGDVRIRIKGPVDRSVLREVFLAARTTR